MSRFQCATARMLGVRRIGARAPRQRLVEGDRPAGGGWFRLDARQEPSAGAGGGGGELDSEPCTETAGRSVARTLTSGAFPAQALCFGAVHGLGARGWGTNSFRQDERGAKTPWKRISGKRGGGRIAAI